MSNYDRFKPTALAAAKERKQEVINITNEYDNDNGDRIKRMNIKKDGVYKVRMWPAHPIAGANSIEPKVIYFVPSMRKKKDANNNFVKDKEGNDVMEESVKPVFDARVHGESKYDLVDSYITLVKAKAKAKFPDDTDGEKKFLAPIVGDKFTGGNFMGMQPIRSFLFYGELLTGEGENAKKEFHEFEVGKAVEKGLQKTAAVENNNDPLGTDGCFTDIEEGRPMKIIVDGAGSKAAKDPSLYYSVSLVTETVKENVNGKMQSIIKSYPISEEELDWFEKEVEPLINYRKIFSRRDLDFQLKGLEMFDNNHGFGIIETDDFKDVYNYLDAKFPVVNEESTSEGGQTTTTQSTANVDQLDLMDLKELKAYAKELGLSVLPRFTEDDLKSMIRELEAGDNDNPTSEDETPEADNHEQEQPQAETVTQSPDWKSKIQGLKNKVASE